MSDTDDRAKRQYDRVREFSEVLEGIKNLEGKKKLLWMQIYENALSDRENAFALFSKMRQTAEDNPETHILAGPTLAKYIERLTRANDQLLKLAELIQRAETADETLNMDDIYDKIQG